MKMLNVRCLSLGSLKTHQGPSRKKVEACLQDKVQAEEISTLTYRMKSEEKKMEVDLQDKVQAEKISTLTYRMKLEEKTYRGLFTG
jgi:hypothetical protein